LRGDVWTERRGDVAIVHLAGEHDLSTAPAIADAVDMATAECRRVVIDLSSVTFFDSSVLGIVLRSRSKCVTVSGEGTLAARRLALLGLGQVVGVVASLEAAVAGLIADAARER